MGYSFHHKNDIVVAAIDGFERNADWQKLKKDLHGLFEKGNRKLIVDIGRVSELPVSAFWTILIAIKKEYDAAAGGFVLTGQSGAAIDERMAALGLTKIFRVAATVSDAIDLLSA